MANLNLKFTNLIKNILDYIFNKRVNLFIYNEPDFSIKRLKEKNVDIIVANFSLPQFDFAHVVHVDNVPEKNAISLISQLIDDISIQKYNHSYYVGI
ncbi:hypothetical protein [Fundicoccus ignavus]|uniref:hypothetical protein n=1 Tax=Fundicoccus ignavus TaxID=2664442 RepID=UPI001562B190|nr:hypothetical protein [Fundicoccus ignavus]